MMVVLAYPLFTLNNWSSEALLPKDEVPLLPVKVEFLPQKTKWAVQMEDSPFTKSKV
jgi:hypothetical protein